MVRFEYHTKKIYIHHIIVHLFIEFVQPADVAVLVFCWAFTFLFFFISYDTNCSDETGIKITGNQTISATYIAMTYIQ